MKSIKFLGFIVLSATVRQVSPFVFQQQRTQQRTVTPLLRRSTSIRRRGLQSEHTTFLCVKDNDSVVITPDSYVKIAPAPEYSNVNIFALISVTAAGLAGLIFLLISKSAIEGSWRYFAAGGICASFSHAVATPIDVIKTRQQVDEGNFVSHTDGKNGTDSYHHSYGIAKTIRNLMKEEGAGILLAGLGPTTIGYFFEGALKFGIYEVSIYLWARWSASDNLCMLSNMHRD